MQGDKASYDLHGAVRTVHIEVMKFEEEDGRKIEKPWYSYTVSFNPDGKMASYVHRNPDGSTWRTVNEYSPTDKLISTKSYDSSEVLAQQMRFLFDQDGRLSSEQTVALDGTTSTTVVHLYDERRRRKKIQQLEFSGEGDVMIGIEDTGTSISAIGAKRIETCYDEHDAAIEVLIYNQDEALVSRVEIVRDEHGHVLEENQYLGEVVRFEPCSTGACTTEKQVPLTEEQQAELEAEMKRVFAPGAALSQHIHSYDEYGRKVESRLTMLGMSVSSQTFAYDETGHKIEEANYNEDGSLQSKALFALVYDEHGNWTSEMVSSASSWDAEFKLTTPQHVTRRSITYY